MTASEQQQLVEDYVLIENPQERFGLLVARSSPLAPLEEAEKIDENLVPGCISQVWLAGSLEDGRCRFRVQGDSTVVHAVAALLCEWFDGLTPEEVLNSPKNLLDQLKISSQLSPTRRRGMGQVVTKICSLAESWHSTPS
tara:strand:- start:3866 stop:4285 length:420 start_codon:yes stop_codon:yes gene_type:complete